MHDYQDRRADLIFDYAPMMVDGAAAESALHELKTSFARSQSERTSMHRIITFNPGLQAAAAIKIVTTLRAAFNPWTTFAVVREISDHIVVISLTSDAGVFPELQHLG